GDNQSALGPGPKLEPGLATGTGVSGGSSCMRVRQAVSGSSRGRAGRPGRLVCPGLAGSRTLQMTRPVPLPRTISASRLSGYHLLHKETCPPVPARGQAPPQCPVTLSEAPANPATSRGLAGWRGTV
ncbi:MAG: hypothetical protein ACK6EB_41685, partial [Planctomyces sp.]